MTTSATPSVGWSRRLSALAAALPCLFLSYVLFSVWVDPMAWDNGRWVPYGVGLMLLEFIVLHSGGMLAGYLKRDDSAGARLKYAVAMLVFYGLMVVGFALTLDSIALLWVFATVMLGRLGILVRPAEAARRDLERRSAIGVVGFMAATAASIFIAVPELGITQEVLNQVYPQRGGGVWERHPERAIVAAAGYFAFMGIAEIWLLPVGSDTVPQGAS